MSAIDDLPPLREVIRRHGLSARKSLGQNFLFDLNLTSRIARSGGPLAGVTVIEVGPGPGGLTRALLAAGAHRVIAIERDRRCLAALADIAAHYPERLTVLEGDALRVDPVRELGGAPARIVANLPYNVATSLLVNWLTVEPWPPWYDSMTLMFQREVAERIVAAPGSKSYGRLSVLAGWRTQARILFDIAPSAFVPPPKVTSSVVRLVPRATPARWSWRNPGIRSRAFPDVPAGLVVGPGSCSTPVTRRRSNRATCWSRRSPIRHGRRCSSRRGRSWSTWARR